MSTCRRETGVPIELDHPADGCCRWRSSCPVVLAAVTFAGPPWGCSRWGSASGAGPDGTGLSTSIVNLDIDGHGAHDPDPAPATPNPRMATMGDSTITASIRHHRSCWPFNPRAKPTTGRKPTQRGPRGRRSITSASRSDEQRSTAATSGRLDQRPLHFEPLARDDKRKRPHERASPPRTSTTARPGGPRVRGARPATRSPRRTHHTGAAHTSASRPTLRPCPLVDAHAVLGSAPASS